MFIREIVERAPAQPDEGPLALANPHERDACIMFREEDHAYFVFHKASDTYLRLWKSVSGLYKLYFSDFDAEAMSRTVARKRKADKQSPYYWLIQHQACPDDEEAVAATIRDAWSRLGDRASSEGTEVRASPAPGSLRRAGGPAGLTARRAGAPPARVQDELLRL